MAAILQATPYRLSLSFAKEMPRAVSQFIPYRHAMTFYLHLRFERVVTGYSIAVL
jgi:cyclophilin family peptidyl-prolyl cis-trans isomerase